MILSQSVTLGLSLVHMDVVTAFLNGFLNEEIYDEVKGGFHQPLVIKKFRIKRKQGETR